MTNLVVVNPATEEAIAELPQATREDVRRAIDAAWDAFASWSALPLRKRTRVLLKTAELAEAAREDLLKTLVAESGKPIRDAEAEITRAIDIFRSSAEEAKLILEGSAPRVDAYEYPIGNENRLVVAVREPVGVVGGALSYNNPASTFAHKVAPVIAAGNTVVVKPSSYTPLTALKFLEIMKRAGVPEGVVNVVVGSGEEVFDELIQSDKVAGINFTGSTAVGLQVAAKAASRGKKFMIAPGGSDPAVVFKDADLDAAARIVARARYENAGQNCNATKRVFVEREVYPRFVELLLGYVKAIRVGDPMDYSTDMGPLISEKIVKAMDGVVKDALEKGAKLAAGGRRMNRRGYFYEPTVLLFDGDAEAKALREEVFGPVLPVVPFEGEEEAVRLANATQYGLQSAVFTSDYRKALRVARGIKAGAVMINESTRVRFDALPYGGVKMSGFGWREGVRSTMIYYTEPKFLVFGL
ncbi:aldehyde dehydrogenase family protein [Pyrobaculum neutrophilum]|uniref:Aldehyde Dehydrogenase n=1 Tax=Pyrobaculum neutrophilum (strain DSM 2338 / JCM 9278 / NBRC 100436 / V24Sta) TaxID=444157 RepID=B1YBY5_PYRNV|nr:aldehyde dehydrogenase family protein [Pyrobaculum neutrophilum]ACB39369.1 Aldehyde Dehydrogenase [Pyrobaculum neutrophilum V24Sta]